MPPSIILIPTYNEKENIRSLISALFNVVPFAHVLVIDDNSPDGTGILIEEMLNEEPRLHLLKRAKKEGLGPAYIAGFKWALESGFEYIVQMDADFSHPPSLLETIFNGLHKYDLVIGCRYKAEGGITGWGITRQLISRGGNLYAQLLLNIGIKDLTGGFNGWRSSLLKKINLDAVKSVGYAFQVELKYRSHLLKASILEVPFHFENRRLGKSKMSHTIIQEAALRVIQMRLGL